LFIKLTLVVSVSAIFLEGCKQGVPCGTNWIKVHYHCV
jgi:hypothetical protein